MSDDEVKVTKRVKRLASSATVTVVNNRGVEANPLRGELDMWLEKGWSVKTPAQAE